MAFLVAKPFSLTLVLISLFLSSSSHARDSQYFSKVGGALTRSRGGAAEFSNQQVEKPEEQTDIGNYPSFHNQESEKAYGLYAAPPPPTIPARGSPPPPKHTFLSESTLSSWRPDNYNTESYVTPLAEEFSSVDDEANSYTTTRNNGYHADEGNRIPTTVHQQEPRYTTTTKNRNNNNNDDRPGAMFVGPLGMSDTRYLANGMYHYDVKNQVYSKYHPYEVLKATNRNAQLPSNNYEFLPNAFTGYKSYESANNYNSMNLNEEGRLFEQEDDSDMP